MPDLRLPRLTVRFENGEHGSEWRRALLAPCRVRRAGRGTIRNFESTGLKRRLRVIETENSRSMEEEARDILRRTVGVVLPPK